MAGYHSIQYPKDAKEYVHDIVRLLQNKMQSWCGLRASEVFKGGSLGQGTAVSGDFDLDLIVYSTDLRKSDMTSGNLGYYLTKVDELLAKEFGRRKYQRQSITMHAVRFSLDGVLDVDLLLSPHYSTPDQLYREIDLLHNDDQRRMFSCSAAKWFCQFIEEQDILAKEFIKRAKAWRNKKWPTKDNGQGRPKSILISLLVVKAFQRSHQKDAQSVTALIKEYVVNHKCLNIHWTPGEGAKYEAKYFRPPAYSPYIIDPSNPFNNVYKSGIGMYTANSAEGTYEPGDGDWTMFVHYVSDLDLTQADGTANLRTTSAGRAWRM